MSNLISVIIPVYNAEKYLLRCIGSICEQTYTNLEIILVNDGSTDRSKQLCEQLLKEDSRIKLINQTNGGSSIARNTGLENATGDFISFIDSDDYIENVMLEQMLNLSIEHNIDVVEIERNTKDDNEVFDNSFTIEDTITAAERIIKTTSFQVWKRLYKKSVVETMRFIPNIIHQDVFFTVDVLNKVSAIGFLNSKLYIYNRDSIGIIRSKYSTMKMNIATRATEYLKDNLPKSERIKNVMNNYIVNYYTDHYFLASRNTTLDKDKTFRKKIRKEIINSINTSNISLRAFLVIALPAKLMEKVSKKYQSIKQK